MATLEDQVAARKKARLSGVPVVNGKPVTTTQIDESQLRINPRAAEVIHEQQAAERRENIATNQEEAGFEQGAAVTRGIQPNLELDPQTKGVLESIPGRQVTGASGQPGAVGYNPHVLSINPKTGMSFKLEQDLQNEDNALQELIKTGTAGPQSALIFQQKKANLIEQERVRLQNEQNQRQNLETGLAMERPDFGSKTEPRVDPVRELSTSIDQGAASLLLAQVPPEYQSIMKPVIDTMLGAAGAGMQDQTAQLFGSKALADQVYAGTISSLDAMDARAKENSGKVQSLLDTLKQNSEKHLKDIEQVRLEQINYERERGLRDLAKQKAAAADQAYAEAAITGSFGSSNTLEAIREQDMAFETAMLDLSRQSSMQKDALLVELSGKYIGIQEAYALNTIKEVNALADKLDANSLKKIGAEQSKAEAYDKAFATFTTNVGKLRSDLASNIGKLGDTAISMIADSRKAKVDRDNTLWDRLFTQRAQDANLNPALTQKILDEMSAAGIDVSGIDPYAMTLEQANEMARAQQEAEKASGRTPVATMVNQLRDADVAFGLLDELEFSIAEYEGVGGPLGGMTGLGDTDPGWLASTFKFGADIATGVGVGRDTLERQREAVATFNLVKQVIGKAIEGGVLRKEDELKYEKLLPTLRDTDRLRAHKLAQLRDMMEEGKRSILDNMQRSGYNTSGYNLDSYGNPYDPIDEFERSPLTDEEAQEILDHLESGEPLSSDSPTGFLDALARAHVRHEGYGTKEAVTITEGNNPGALKFLPHMAEKYGAKKGKNNFAMFPDFNSGYRALISDLRAKIGGNSAHIDYSSNPTLLSYVKVYAPESDGNNPKGYAAALVRSLRKSGYNVDLDTPLSELALLIG